MTDRDILAIALFLIIAIPITLGLVTAWLEDNKNKSKK